MFTGRLRSCMPLNCTKRTAYVDSDFSLLDPSLDCQVTVRYVRRRHTCGQIAFSVYFNGLSRVLKPITC